jgi:hypothetical protein
MRDAAAAGAFRNSFVALTDSGANSSDTKMTHSFLAKSIMHSL